MRYDLPNGLYYGQITVALPYYNSYQVRVQGYGSLTAIGMTVGADERIGHRGGANYPAGAYVVIMVPNDISEESNNVDYPAVILGGVAPYPVNDMDDTDIDPDNFGPNLFQFNSPVDINNNLLYENILNNAEEPALAQDRSYNRFMDNVPGDFTLSTPLGGILHLGDFMARIGAAPSANISCYSLEEAVNIVAKNYSLDMDTYSWQKYTRGDKFLIIEGISLSTLEAAGGYPGVAAVTREVSTDPDTEGEVTLEPIAEDQAPLLREQNFRGSDVDGEYKTTQTPKETSEINTLSSEHIGLFSEARRIDGIVRVAASKEIAFRKTPIIRIAEPRLDYDTTDRTTTDVVDGPEPWEELGLTEDEYRAVYNIVAEAGNELEDTTIFMRGLRQDIASGIWAWETNTEILTKVFEDSNPPEIPDLADDEVEYPQDTMPTEDVEITPEREVKIFKNSSVFIMEDNGGITIGDGYGSEIRMFQGNITITCPGDMKLLPGRDLQVMAPGNAVIKTGKRVEITSTTDSVSIKAEENLHLLGGNGGEGSTIIENKATATNPNDIEDSDLLDGVAYGSGIELKANGQISHIANSHYIGGRDAGDPSKTGTEGKCDIVLNAGRTGGILMHSGSHTAVANSTMALSMVSAISGMYLNSGRVSVVSPGTIDLAGSTINIDKVQASNVKIPKIIRDDVGDRNIKNINNSAPNLLIQGNILCKGNAGFGGAVISSKAGVFKDGANPEPIPEANFQHPIIPASQSQQIGSNLKNALTSAIDVANSFVDNYGTLTTYAQQVLGMAYPNTDSDVYHADNFFIRSSMWQDMLTGTETWTEKPVKHDIVDETLPYPGKDAYDKSDAYIVTERDGTQTDEKLETYKVNTKGLT